MEHAVALVQAYLQVNGYFTVVEYPLLEARSGLYHEVTDLDVLAFRFPRAGRPLLKGRVATGPIAYEPDPELGCAADEADMIIAEVKQGQAELNSGARSPEVLAAALARFGCCPPEQAAEVVKELLRHGHARTHAGHRVRLLAFGSTPSPTHGHFRIVTLGHVVHFLRDYIRENWPSVVAAHPSQPALGLLVAIEKALAAERPEAPLEPA